MNRDDLALILHVSCLQCGAGEPRYPDGWPTASLPDPHDMSGRSCAHCGIGPMRPHDADPVEACKRLGAALRKELDYPSRTDRFADMDDEARKIIDEVTFRASAALRQWLAENVDDAAFAAQVDPYRIRSMLRSLELAEATLCRPYTPTAWTYRKPARHGLPGE